VNGRYGKCGIMAFYVYILKCSDKSYYTGHTDNLEKRLFEHINGEITSCYTFKRRPVELVFSETFGSRVEALAAEQQIKGWSRAKKEAMMRGDWKEVSRMAKSKCALRQAQGERECKIQENFEELGV
jgi:predicted GIY-YIG superfamily endonuclease